MYDTHTPAEWLRFAFLGISIPAALAAPLALMVDAEVWRGPALWWRLWTA